MGTHTHRLRLSLFLVLALLTSAARASADDTPTASHVRTESTGLRALIADAGRRSSTLSALVAHLNRSDVFVYVEHQRLPPSLNGRLTLVGSTDGWRYIRIQLDCRGILVEQMGMLGHELRHAVEIADAPHVVDPTSLQQLYGRIGFSTDAGRNYDTQAAVDTGRLVMKEVLSHTITVAER
jgi:hypothetical protein